MVKPILIAILLASAVIGGCSASGGGSVATSAEVAGSYECFGVGEAGMSSMGSLVLNEDGTGAFGSTALTWTYDPNSNSIQFEGAAGLQDATYLPDGPSLSVNLRADVIVTGAPEGHFTCVKSSEESTAPQ